MNLDLSDKEIRILKIISQIAGGFTIIVALTMILSLVQLKIIKPLDNPALLAVKEQFDKDQSNVTNAAQVRAMDLMARKAYFSSRWQVETGSYLLLAGAVIFLLCQRLIADSEKIRPNFSEERPEYTSRLSTARRYLVYSASAVFVLAVGASFILRSELPDLSGASGNADRAGKKGNSTASKPDKTNYPFFRGHDSRGIAGGSGYPEEWSGETGKNILWKTTVPKNGQSSPVIWDDKLFLTGAEDLVCEVYCIDKNTGKLLWTGAASGIAGEPSAAPDVDRETGLAASTVATNGDYVCAIFANGNLVCFDPDGKLIWAKNIGTPESSYGYSNSPVIYGDNLLVQYDSNTKIALYAFDLKSGEQKWETIRQGRPVWSSPVIAYFDGVAQVVINGNPNVSGFDAETGRELWAVDCMMGDVAPSVAVNSTMAYAVTDYAKLVGIKPGTAPSIIWEDNSYTPDVSSPVANDQFLFLTTGNGDVACYNAGKGDTLWTHYFSEPFYASPIIADEKVYLLDRSGTMHIIAADGTFNLISEPALGESADCTPAFSDKKIFIRTKNNLFCIAD